MPQPIATQPIKLGILIDTLVSDDIEPDARVVIKNTFALIFDDAFHQGVLDRPVELVYREVDGCRGAPRRQPSMLTASSATKVVSPCSARTSRRTHAPCATRSNVASWSRRSASTARTKHSGSGPSDCRTAP